MTFPHKKSPFPHKKKMKKNAMSKTHKKSRKAKKHTKIDPCPQKSFLHIKLTKNFFLILCVLASISVFTH